MAAQTYDVIRTRRLEIVNNAGQTVVEMFGSSTIGGHIFVNSPEGEHTVSLVSGLISIDGVIFVNSYEDDKNLVYIGSSASSGDGLVLINSTGRKELGWSGIKF